MQLTDLGFVLLFVEDPIKSSSFYEKALGQKPIEQSPTFALFSFTNGIKLGLWSRHTTEPVVNLTGGGCEIAFSEVDVDALFQKWKQLGIAIIQEPTDMDFGRSFVALDPDGHRIRIYRL